MIDPHPPIFCKTVRGTSARLDEALCVKTTRFARRVGRAALTLCERAAIKPKETSSQQADGLSAVILLH